MRQIEMAGEPLISPASTNGAHIEGKLSERVLRRFTSREDRIGQAVDPISIAVAGKDEILKRIEKHLTGELRLGLYNLLADGTVQWAVVEFETHGPGKVDQPLESARQFQTALGRFGICAYIERSKSVNDENYHLWLFFDSSLDAKRVHSTLKAVLKATGLNPACEVFPKGVSGIGNCVWLPFFGGEDQINGKPGGGVLTERTVFLDEAGHFNGNVNRFLTDVRGASLDQFIALERAMVPYLDSSLDRRVTKQGTLKQLQRVLDNCPFIAWCEQHAGDLPEPLWWAMISNLCRFDGGESAIHRISSKDSTPGRYDPTETNEKIERALEASGPITYETIKALGWSGNIPSWPRSPAGFGAYADLDRVLEELKALKGAERYRALRQHFDEDFHELPVSRQGEWIVTLATNLGIAGDELRSMARASFSEMELAGHELKEMLARLSEMQSPPEERGRLIFDWFRENGGLAYRDRDHKGYWIWKGTVYDVGNNQPFHTFIWSLAGITHEGTENKKIWAVLKAETDCHGTFLNSFSWLHSNASQNCIYLHLNLANEQIIRIDSTGVELVDNGANPDSVLLAPASKMLPVDLVMLDAKAYRDAWHRFDELVLRNMACSRSNQLLYGCWALCYPLLDFVKVRPHLRCEGETSGGKTRTMELISHFVYGASLIKKGTDAANYADAARNPLSLFDNIEVANFSQAFGDFILTVVTGITKEKRQLGTDHDTILERAHCLVNTTGIENLGRTEHINRTYAIVCDRWAHKAPGWSERIYARITDERPLFLSAHMMLISHVLKKIADGKMEWWQNYLEVSHPAHAKDRSNSFIALMALILEELLAVIDPTKRSADVVAEWIKTQDDDGKEVTVASHPILTLLNAVMEDSLGSPFGSQADFAHWGYEVKCNGREITGTASQLHNTFCAVKKRKNLIYDYKTPLQLSRRIADLVRSLQSGSLASTNVKEGKVRSVETDVFTLSTVENRSGSAVYTFRMTDPDAVHEGDEEPNEE